MFEISDLATIIQMVSLAAALVSGAAALIYFVRKPRETEEYAEDQSRPSNLSRNYQQTSEPKTVPENPSPTAILPFEQPPYMVSIYVPMYVPKSALDEILRSMSTQTSRTPPRVTPPSMPSMKFTPPLPKSPKSKDLKEELIRRVEK